MEGTFSSHGAEPASEGALAPYVRAIRARRLLVVLLTLVTLGAAIAYVQHRAPSYEASSEILLTPLPQDDKVYFGMQVLRMGNDETRTAQTAATLVNSDEAAALAAQRIDRGATRGSVQGAISVQPQGQSDILSITAKGSDPKRTAQLANAYARAAVDARRNQLQRELAVLIAQAQAQGPNAHGRLTQLQQLRGTADPTLSVSQQATIPSSPTGTSKSLIVLLALVAGFTIASGVALLLEAVDQRIREPEEMLSLYPLPVLARVPRLPRSQRRGRGRDLVMPPAVREAFRSLHIQIEDLNPNHRVIMFTSASSGDGKTTSALNLALALVAVGNRVVLMDLDLRKPDLGRLLGFGQSGGLVSLLGSDRRLEDVLKPAPSLPQLSVAAAGTGDGDVLLLGALGRQLPRIVGEARALADYVVLDTAPLGEVSDALRVAGEADAVIVVGRPGHTSRPSFELMRDLLTRAGRTPIGIVIVGTRTRGLSASYTYGTPSRPARRRRFTVARSPSR